jgi:hypothetical protein
MSQAVRGCAPISAAETPWFQKASGPFAASRHPAPAEMNPPADRLTHRHRSAAAGAEITLVGGRRAEFARHKIAVNDLVDGVAPPPLGDPRLSPLNRRFHRPRARSACHGFLLLAFTAHHQIERPRRSLRRPTELDLVGDGRRGSVGSKLAAGGSLRRRSTPAGRGCRVGAARPRMVA